MDIARLKTLFESQLKERVQFNAPLKSYVAYGVGGPADILVFPKTEEDLSFTSSIAERENLPVTIIGEGTNLLVRDGGIRGITVSTHQALKEIEIVSAKEDDTVLVRCGGGVKKPDLLNWAIEHSLTGLEFSSGVPGTIGGGIFMNAGTKYGSYGDILREIRLFDFKSGSKQFVTTKEQFGYRHQTLVGDSLVVWALFELKRGDSKTIREEVDRIIAERAEKQPLNFPSCGSTFKNPEGYSAGRLIEKAGLKGTRIGGAEISTKHANFILNKENASANDILELISLIQTAVHEQFDIRLETEVIILGDTDAHEV